MVLADVRLGDFLLGESYSLFIQWDGVKFTAQLDGLPPVSVNPSLAANAAPPAAEPIGAGKNLSTRLNVGPGESGWVMATFDNVRTADVVW